METKNFGKWASAFVMIMFLATTMHVNAEIHRDFAISNEERGLTWTIDMEEEFLLGGIVEIIPPHEPTGEETPEFDGSGKSSVLIVRSIRFPDETLRLRLRGESTREWIRFNGHHHESTTSFFIEVWLEDGRYACDNITMSCNWWGGPELGRLNIDAHGFRITWSDLETYPLEKIHIYAERVVDNFPPEIHDRTFEKYIFDVAELSSALVTTEIKMLS